MTQSKVKTTISPALQISDNGMTSNISHDSSFAESCYRKNGAVRCICKENYAGPNCERQVNKILYFFSCGARENFLCQEPCFSSRLIYKLGVEKYFRTPSGVLSSNSMSQYSQNSISLGVQTSVVSQDEWGGSPDDVSKPSHSAA